MNNIHCKQCKTYLTPDNFWKDKSHSNGLENRCKGCNQDRMRRRRYAKKMKVIEYLGGECVKCGVTLKDIHYSAFDCNHKDPSQKSFAISSAGFDFEKIKDELDKCELVCSNCHRKITYENFRN